MIPYHTITMLITYLTIPAMEANEWITPFQRASCLRKITLSTNIQEGPYTISYNTMMITYLTVPAMEANERITPFQRASRLRGISLSTR